MGSLDIYFFSLASVDVASMKADMAEDKKSNVILEQSIWLRDSNIEVAKNQK